MWNGSRVGDPCRALFCLSPFPLCVTKPGLSPGFVMHKGIPTAIVRLRHKKIVRQYIRGLLEKYPTFGLEKETGLLGALDTYSPSK